MSNLDTIATAATINELRAELRAAHEYIQELEAALEAARLRMTGRP
jgi:hypothetical protein